MGQNNNKHRLKRHVRPLHRDDVVGYDVAQAASSRRSSSSSATFFRDAGTCVAGGEEIGGGIRVEPPR